MAVAARLENLDQRHTELEQAISNEMRHPGFDEFKVLELKRRKLRIRDEIEELMRSHNLN
ncbi:MAG: DUF465 domain-containing protein [Pseudomonadota bacterium]